MSQLNATVTEKIDITPDLIILRVKPDNGISDFKPGQYLAMGLPIVDPEGKEKMVRKAYSIGSSPAVKDYLEFYIAIVKDGALTPHLHKLNPGEKLHVAPKIVGDFTLDPVPSGSNAVFVSTGTGLAPFISMIKTPETWDKVNNIRLLHGVRYKPDLAYRDELLELQNNNPRFSYHPYTSREEPEAEIKKGYVQDLFKKESVALDPTTDHVYLCGNPAMVEELEKYLTELGFKEHTRKEHGNLHMEKYW